MTTDDLNVVLLVGMAVLFAGAIAVTLASKMGLPALLAFLGVGLLMGEAGLGIEFDDKNLMQVIGFVALAVILAEGGLSTKLNEIKPALPFAVVLASAGVGVSVGIVAIFVRYALGVDWQLAILIGAIVSSTDAAAVFSILRRLRITSRVRAALEAESGLNDPPVVILVLIVVAGPWGETGIVSAAGMFTYQLVVGAIVAIVVARVGEWTLRRIAVPEPGLYPAATFGLPLFAFGLAGAIGASGFLAAYVAGLLLCNAGLPHRHLTLNFAHGVAWIAQIVLFVLLGLLATPSTLQEAIIPALIIGLALLIVARPISIFASAFLAALRFRHPLARNRKLVELHWGMNLPQQAFLSWAGLRGAVPIVLATIPQAQGVPGTDNLFDIVLVLVVVFTIIQGPSLPWVARKLGVAEESKPALREPGSETTTQ